MASASQSLVQAEPEYSGEPVYLDGYMPSSLDSPHSSLQRTSTWVGMGLILASVAGFGTLVFGLGAWTFDVQPDGTMYMIIGAILALVCLISGAVLIHHGQADYRSYVKRTGRTM